jgi:hypothetical protein
MNSGPSMSMVHLSSKIGHTAQVLKNLINSQEATVMVQIPWKLVRKIVMMVQCQVWIWVTWCKKTWSHSPIMETLQNFIIISMKKKANISITMLKMLFSSSLETNTSWANACMPRICLVLKMYVCCVSKIVFIN